MSPPTDDFIVVLEDNSFYKLVSMFSKNYGMTIAKEIESKLRRKHASTCVISLTEALKPEYKKILTPFAVSYMIYHKHPVYPTRYLGIRTFHETVLDQKK